MKPGLLRANYAIQFNYSNNLCIGYSDLDLIMYINQKSILSFGGSDFQSTDLLPLGSYSIHSNHRRNIDHKNTCIRL